MSYNSASKGAIIHEFKSSNNIVNNGESFTLSWNVDADKIDLNRNGAFFQTLGASQQSIERTEFYDNDEDVTYELVAYKNGVKSKSKPIIIKSAARTPSLDLRSINHLAKAAPRAMLTAIIGIIGSILFMIAGITIAISYPNDFLVSFVVIIIALILLFPMIFLFRFASKMKRGLATNDNNILVESFKNLRLYFVYTGITVLFILISIIAIWAFSK